MTTPTKKRRFIKAILAAPIVGSLLLLSSGNAFASGTDDPYNPPAFTDGNNWYNADSAAAYALEAVKETQPFDEACTWFVSNALWAGGLPEDDTWNENTSHGVIWNFGQGSPTAADVNLFAQYILQKYPASYLAPLDLSPGASAWPVALGDVVVYVWDGDSNWLTDGDHNTHTALITHIEDSGYPDVSEWGDAGDGNISPDAASPGNTWAGYRGFTWSAMANEWLQQESNYSNMTAFVLHIDTSTPVTY